MINLIVVVDPNFGDRLDAATAIAPVWAVAAPKNIAACRRIWNVHGACDHRERGAVTSFDVDNPADPFTNLLNILPDLEVHHGVICDNEFSFPIGFTLEVIGLAPTNDAQNALREYGFSSFIDTGVGIRARK